MRNTKRLFALGCLFCSLSLAASAEDATIPSAINPESASSNQLQLAKEEMAAIEMIQDAGSHGTSHPGKCSRKEFEAGCFMQRGERQPDQKNRARNCFCP